MKAWTTRDSAELYNINGWSNGFFEINDEGNVAVTPFGQNGGKIDLKRVVDDLVRRGLSMPLLIRFSDILQRRVEQLSGAFASKIRELNYKNEYLPIMPIKVNQQRHVIEELVQFGKPFRLGLEAGSKPELLVAITLLEGQDGTIICNGYKDQAYIETALLAQRLGLKVLIIADRFQELETVVECSKRLGLKPTLGVRAKLATRGAGRWAESGGDRSKFGLTAGEMVAAVEMLEREGLLDRLVCLHFHIGSQITAIRSVKEAMTEGVRIFADLCRMGAPMTYFDVGGGLAVDYDGSQTNFHASKNYSLEEYAADIVDAIGSTLDNEGIPHPTIISESGRALVAHHSVLVFNVLGHSEVNVGQRDEQAAPTAEEPQVVRNLWDVYSGVSRKNYQESYHDAVQLKEDALSLFRHGFLDLKGRARVERLFWTTVRKIWRIVRELDYVPDDLEGLEKDLADIYFCNFSVFQSVPDSWAIDALFPIMPIHRLNERPTRLGILADLTCDSDGKIDGFIDLHDVKKALELHPYRPGQPYFLAVFLVGAYQEILGDLHNLFGDVNAVHIAHDPERGYSVRNVVTGDRVSDVLRYVQYDQSTMMARIRQSIEVALTRGTMTFEESANLVRHFEAGLSGYTYLEEPQLAEALLNSLVPRREEPRLAAVPDPAPDDGISMHG
ncbi:MAG: biosynthetic arginine decarboxylase [Deltaproteobacteria bacterium]|nr:biosynthetic arginine decarboxylase [Deltaproteobacteria bacterium]